MDVFTSSPCGRYVGTRVVSAGHGDVRFTLSTLAAGDLGLHNRLQRKLYLHESGVTETRVKSFSQTHSKTVSMITASSVSPTRADGGVTIDPGVLLSITVADCLPIALFDTKGGGLALVHSGWRGTGIAAVALDMMQHHFETRPETVTAVIGPGIGGCCYDVPQERASSFDSYGETVVSRRDGRVYLDLKEANRLLLERLGVRDIRVSSLCTRCSGFLGSFRRQGPADFTRMLAVVGHF